MTMIKGSGISGLGSPMPHNRHVITLIALANAVETTKTIYCITAPIEKAYHTIKTEISCV